MHSTKRNLLSADKSGTYLHKPVRMYALVKQIAYMLEQRRQSKPHREAVLKSIAVIVIIIWHRHY
jgi:hypothetical protein